MGAIAARGGRDKERPSAARRSQGLERHLLHSAHGLALALLDLVAARGGRAHIPTSRDRKVQRSVDPALYRHRNLIERFLNKLKHFRRIATRYDKLARNCLAAVLIASTAMKSAWEKDALDPAS